MGTSSKPGAHIPTCLVAMKPLRELQVELQDMMISGFFHLVGGLN